MLELIPYSVRSHLYGAISREIKKLTEYHRSNNWTDHSSSEFLELKESIDWYHENCIVSSKYIREAYAELSNEISGKYFLYNLYTHHRFTLRYQLAGEQLREKYNCLYDRNMGSLKRIDDIVLDKVINYNGMSLKIVEVFETIDEKYGKFIAQTLSIEEQLNISRKGGY